MSQCTATNWEVSYRYKDSLATCNVWASTEEQAEKKFRARKEYEYDPKYDQEADGNIRSIYLTPVREPKPLKKKIDELKKFVMFPEFGDWLRKYDSGDEQALVKQVPLTEKNKSIIDKISKIVPIIRRYRGSSRVLPDGTFYKRPREHCTKLGAERVSIYLK